MLSLLLRQVTDKLGAGLSFNLRGALVGILVVEERGDEGDASTEIANQAPKDKSNFLILSKGADILEKMKDHILTRMLLTVVLGKQTLGSTVDHTHLVKSTYKQRRPLPYLSFLKKVSTVVKMLKKSICLESQSELAN